MQKNWNMEDLDLWVDHYLEVCTDGWIIESYETLRLKIIGWLILTLSLSALGASSGDSHLFGDIQRQDDSNTGCCSMQLKTGVQIICGFYAILSSLILVSYYATLEKSIIDKYILYFGSKSQYAQYQQQYTNNPTNPNYDKPDTKLIEVRDVILIIWDLS